MMEDNVKRLREGYAAFNRGDFAEFAAIFDAEGTWVEPSDSPGAGVTRGPKAIRAHCEHHRASWAEGACTPVEVRVVGERIVQIVDVRVRLTGEEAWREGRLAEVYTFRNGKVVEGRVCWKVEDGMAYAARTD